jgi:hypothetical protein
VSVIRTHPPVVLERASRDFADATSTPPFLYQLTPAEARKVLDDVPAAPIDKLPVMDRPRRGRPSHLDPPRRPAQRLTRASTAPRLSPRARRGYTRPLRRSSTLASPEDDAPPEPSPRRGGL